MFVEGIGGTGKAIINLLKFTDGVAEIIGDDRPPFEYGVVDQDPYGVWEGIAKTKAIPALKGQFYQIYGLNAPEQRYAARLLFSDTELRRNVDLGFHGCPKLVAALSKFYDIASLGKKDTTHVLVYSDIGGTGAGVGPVRLTQLLDDPNKKYVIAIVFGKYLNAGSQNPVGYKWLQQRSFGTAADSRAFFGFYINVAPSGVTSSTPPASGLNPAPALLLAAAYIWRLAIDERDNTMETALALSNLDQERIQVRIVEGYYDGKFSLHKEDLIGKLWSSGQSGLLNPLVSRGRTSWLSAEPWEHLPARLNQFLKLDEDSLASECWRVFTTSPPKGSASDMSPNWNALFNETFASVPEELGAAAWFHRGVKDEHPRCRKAFLDLLWLFMQGCLQITEAQLRENGPEVYLLSTQPLKRDNKFVEEAEFVKAVLGACSRKFPFWTVPAFLPNIEREMKGLVNTASNLGEVPISLRTSSECADSYGLKSHQEEEESGRLTIKEQDARCIAVVTKVEHVPLKGWDWAIQFSAKTWQDVMRFQDEWGVLKKRIELYEGEVSVPNERRNYRCAIRGINLLKPFLDEDKIVIGGVEGTQYYCVSREAGDRHTVKRVVADPQRDAQPTFIGAETPLSVSLGVISVYAEKGI